MNGQRSRARWKFRKFAEWVSETVGSPWAFLFATVFIITWVVTGPMFHFSNGWQLIVNTVSNIVTFLMVFLIQNMQNRDTKAIHLKLDELIRANKGARDKLVALEDLSDEDLSSLKEEFERIRTGPESQA